MHKVSVSKKHWQRNGHGGISNEVDYVVQLNGVVLRTFSTHGSMAEGYWGSDAKKMASKYAKTARDALAQGTP